MVPISPEIYSSTAVVMDNRGLSDFILKLEDKRARRAAAEQDAIEKYLADASRKLTPTGMRTQDIPKFQQMETDWRNQALQYKNTKDPYKRLELEQKANEMFLYIQRSKEEGEKGKQTRDYLKNPDAKNKLNLPKLMQDLTLHDLPLDFEGVPALGIPKRKSIDPNATYYKETPFDFKKTFDEAAKGPAITVSELSVKPSDTKGFNVIEKGFSIPTSANIISNFAKSVESDEDKKAYYTIKGRNLSPVRLAELDKALKPYFPKIQVDDDDPISIAMAEAAEEATRRRTSDLQAIPKGTTVNVGGTDGGAYVDYFNEEVKKKLTNPVTISVQGKPVLKGLPVNSLSGTVQTRVIKIAEDITGGKKKYNQANLFIQDNPDDPNLIDVFEVQKQPLSDIPTGAKKLASVTQKDINIEPQVSVKEAREAAAAPVPEVPAKKEAPKKATTTNKWDKYKINR